MLTKDLQNRIWIGFFASLCVVLMLDQAIKWYFLFKGYTQGDMIFEGSVISLLLVYNKGVAFSMFAFLQEWLKYLQILLLVGIFVYLWKHKEIIKVHYIALGVIFGAGISNILDRFIHGGVVDYIFWHYKFEFAIFNFADVMINIGVALVLFSVFLRKDKSVS
ncbi:lipoprotein signal peptidase [Helicobacter sp. MIT 11-5569]|uniref:signal peptidase II n=1 Tax=Helicobacter sp. MIT 11-5569 TaxID=1548151 RepID=UPI0009DE9FD9|nr:signal peptidase II [Helicobacter sp. MIT 11-5569]TLD83479.1 lipoprotein signal peptidase [Helicobacter sp. MIT 11-5569]